MGGGLLSGLWCLACTFKAPDEVSRPLLRWCSVAFQGGQDLGQQPAQQPDKVGWIRKFCGRGIFRELWRNRFMILRGEHLYISEKEVRHQLMSAPVSREDCG